MRTKICTKCGLEKELNQFYKSGKYLRPDCKECVKLNRVESHKKYPWKRVLNDINQRCDNSKHVGYKWYGEKGIENHLIEKDIEFLYIRDNAKNMKKPSIDRKNSNKNYTLENCQFIELKNNVSKGNKESHIKPILQFDLKGNFIREWNSIIEAERVLKIFQTNIIKCCKGKYKSCGGFIWKYKLI